MSRMRACPACHRRVSTRVRFCGHCGAAVPEGRDDRPGHGLLFLAHSARLREPGARGEATAQILADPVSGAGSRAASGFDLPRSPEQLPGPSGGADGSKLASPASNIDRYSGCDPRLAGLVVLLFIPIAMMLPGTVDPWADMMIEVIGRAITVGVQYALLWSLSGERTLGLIVALQVVATIASHQPSSGHRALFALNLLLTLAGLQAVGIAVFRAWHPASQPACSVASPEPPDGKNSAQPFVASGPENETIFAESKGGRHAERRV